MHVITGASSGIGRGLVEALVERDERVVAVARRPEALSSMPVTTVAADVTTAEGRASIADTVDGAPVTSLVHGAGSIIPVEYWTEIDPEELTEHFRVHVAAPIALTATLLERGPVERMVIFDSYSATAPRDGWSAYSILKAAAQMSARGASGELDRTVVARIYPGAVSSRILQTILDAPENVPAGSFYRALEAGGEVSQPIDVGRQMAELLCDHPPEHLATQEIWHVGHTA